MGGVALGVGKASCGLPSRMLYAYGTNDAAKFPALKQISTASSEACFQGARSGLFKGETGERRTWVIHTSSLVLSQRFCMLFVDAIRPEKIFVI
jgi:hypothetical protein